MLLKGINQRGKANKIIIFGLLFSSIRMFVGAISAVYLISIGGLSLKDLGILKSFQSIVIIFLGLYVGKVSDRSDRKKVVLGSFLFCCLWLVFMWIGGENRSLPILYVSELWNAVSISLFSNVYNSYLMDSYYQETSKKNFSEILGKYNQYTFLAIAVSAIMGGYFYHLNPALTPVAPAALLVVVFVFGSIYMPSQLVRSIQEECITPGSMITIKEYRIVFRKILSSLDGCTLFALVGGVYQVLIQYWQVVISMFYQVSSRMYVMGFVFFFIMASQSLAGLVSKNLSDKKPNKMYALLGGGVASVVIKISLSSRNLWAFMVSLLFLFFFLRVAYILIFSDIHKGVYTRIRARFDSFVNVFSRGVSSILLVCSGILAHNQGAHEIIAVIISVFCVIPLLFSFRKAISV